MRAERSMAAVVGPVGIDELQFRHGRVALFGVAEIGLRKAQIVNVHGEAVCTEYIKKGFFAACDKAGDSADGLRDREFLPERRLLAHVRLPRFNGIDQVGAKAFFIVVRERAEKGVYSRGPDVRPVLTGENLNTLRMNRRWSNWQPDARIAVIFEIQLFVIKSSAWLEKQSPGDDRRLPVMPYVVSVKCTETGFYRREIPEGHAEPRLRYHNRATFVSI